MPRPAPQPSRFSNSLSAHPSVGYLRASVYACNAARQLHRQSIEATNLLVWAGEFKAYLDLSLPDGGDDEWAPPERHRRNPPTAEVWHNLTAALSETVAAEAFPDETGGDPITHLARELGFHDTDAAMLRLFADYCAHMPVERLWDKFCQAQDRPPCLQADARLIGLMIGAEPGTIARRLAADGNLRAAGLIRVEANRNISIHHRLLRVAGEPLDEGRDIRTAMLGPKQPASLSFSDFAHLSRDADRVLALLRGGLAERATGLHVLLYGAPGTGKTELAKTLASTLGVPLHAVGESDECGEEPSRQERLGDLQLAQRLLASGTPALLLFDEAEDLFDTGLPHFGRGGPFREHSSFGTSQAGGSRAYMHRLLEQGSAPVIWTANSLRSFGPAVLRRMACCIEVPVPPASVRAALWATAAIDEGVVMPPDELARLSRVLPAAPALARSAMRAARIAGGDPDTVSWAVTGVVRAMNNGKMPVANAAPAGFDPSLVAADVDLAALADRLAAPNAPRAVSLLASGPPGSGKSAFARYLATRMGLEVVQKRASDLLGKYVGETEERIAAAFKEASDQGTFLIFDEADSLLAPRAGAHHNWEVSSVNEMLTWMEQHDFPFCCTTNLLDRVDEAAMRRFPIKARFGFLRPSQVEAAWRRSFAMEPPAGLSALDRLTPADFEVVMKGAMLYGTLGDPTALLRALEGEQRAKVGGSNPIGFGHSR